MVRFLFLVPLLPYGKHYYFNNLISYFEKQGDSITISSVTKNTILRNFCLIKKINSSDYDVLLLGNIRKEDEYMKPSLEIVELFVKAGKPIIYLKIETNYEFLNFIPSSKEKIKVGIPGLFFVKYKHRTFFKPSKKENQFSCPFLVTYREPKLNCLSKEEFFQKYNLDLGKKLIIFCFGRTDKFRRIGGKKDQNSINLGKYADFIKNNFEKVVAICDSLGYQIISKLHVHTMHDHETPEVRKILYQIKHINQNDSYEAFKYSDLAFSGITSMAYELYLYDLPTLDFGTGCYLFQWGSGKIEKYPYNRKMIQKYDHGREMIFGKSVSLSELGKIKETIGQFITDYELGKYQITDFPYRLNHPIFGNTYEFTIPKLYSVIKDQL